jgi:hypothetical protein
MRKVFADSSIMIAGAASRAGASRAVLTFDLEFFIHNNGILFVV